MMNRGLFQKRFLTRLGWVVIFLLLVSPPKWSANAQSSMIAWSPPVNLSRSEDKLSISPFLLADQSGIVHLFWAEKVSDWVGQQADTLLYTYWDGNAWSRPTDIFFAPDSHGISIISQPQAVMDDQGTIHLAWLSMPRFPGYTIYYSSANGREANSPHAWQPALNLADDLTGTEYSFDIAFTSPGIIHILYARVHQGVAREQRAVTYLRSQDHGSTWSNPIDLFTFRDASNGASNVRFYSDMNGRLFASWTEWTTDGNGIRLYLIRSLTNGETWESPQVLAERQPNWYETDWFQMISLGEDELFATWEGGPFAILNFMYSYDGGKSWSEALDTFPDLTGENGFAEYARDSAGTLHMFVPKRIRQGSTKMGGLGLWHSVWSGGKNWSEPELSNGLNDMVNPKVVISGGNRVVAVWYSGNVFEIMAMTGEIVGAPEMPFQPWPTPTLKPTETPRSMDVIITDKPTQVTKAWSDQAPPTSDNQSSLGRNLLFGVFSSFLLISGFIVYQIYRQQRR